MISELVWFIFVFCLGAACALAGAAYGAWYVLLVAKQKTADKVLQLVQLQNQEQQLAIEAVCTLLLYRFNIVQRWLTAH